MAHEKQEFQPSLTLGITWSRLPEDISQRDTHQKSYTNYQRMESLQEVQTTGGKGRKNKGEYSHYPSHRRTTEPEIAYSDSFRLTRSKQNRLPSGFITFRKQHIIEKESPLFIIPSTFEDKTRVEGEKQELF
ncbi:hypothetical protein O181_018487 [Austropuccinia psidii MF-1]|uniref:Uncharacterized protein n=1 Tax=Austropuccinia psidii MF-1 TaxID=1389203 RepID=A0A9Q3C9P2_9BASI|nr:hypothetical protein [Austropuccinia psidii MF-1]